MQTDKQQSILFYSVAALLGAFFMATVGVFARNITADAYAIAFFRMLIGSVFLGGFLLIRRQAGTIIRIPHWTLVITGLLLSFAIIFYLKTMTVTTLANAIILIYLGPVYAAILAHFVLKERLGLRGVIAIMLAAFGVFCLMELKFSLATIGFYGLVWGVASGTLYALYITINRIIPIEIPPFTRAFFQMFSGAVALAPVVGSTMFALPAADYYWLIGVGLVPGVMAFTCVVIALKGLTAAGYGTLSYIEPIAVVIFGWTLYNETLSPLQMLGGVFIIAAGLVQSVRRGKKPSAN